MEVTVAPELLPGQVGTICAEWDHLCRVRRHDHLATLTEQLLRGVKWAAAV